MLWWSQEPICAAHGKAFEEEKLHQGIQLPVVTTIDWPLSFLSSTGQCFLTPSLATNEPGTLPASTTHSLYFQLPEKIFLPTSVALVTSASTENNELWWFVYREQNFRS